MTAGLAWYPAARPAWARLWRAIHARTGLGPADAVWTEDFALHWRDPVLVLAMTCSLPLRLGLPSHVHLVGSPVFDLPGPPGGHDACRLVMRRDDGRADAASASASASAGIAVDAVDVQSGWGTLADAGMTGPVPVTGSPAASMAAVACGPAHLAAIDVVTHALTPHPALTVRATTSPTPAPPFVTADTGLAAPLTGAIAGMSTADRAGTRLSGIVRLPAGAYDAPVRTGPLLRDDPAA